MFWDTIQIDVHKEETRRGNWHENTGLHSGVVSKPDFSLSRVCSYFLVYLYKLRYIFGAIPQENVETNAHTRYGCGLPSWRSGETGSSWGTPSPPGWSVHTAPSCDPQLSMLLPWLPLLAAPPRRYSATRPPPPGPHPTVYPWGSGTRVYFTIVVTSQKYSTALEIPCVLRRDSIAQPPARSVWTGM